MKGDSAIPKNNALIKEDVVLQDSAVIGKNGSKKAKGKCAGAINPEPMKEEGI